MSLAEHTRPSQVDGLPVAPSLAPTLARAELPTRSGAVDPRVVWLCLVAVFVALADRRASSWAACWSG